MRPFHQRPCHLLGLAVLAACLLLPVASAHAIPAFARKYGTSCTTCHTIYPKLNPFGEAFRRNGYRFPGDDSDVVKEDPVALGQDAYKKMFPDAVWPGTLPGSIPLAFGVNGQIDLHPQTHSGAGDAANNSPVDATHLVDEAHLWAGGSIGNTISYFAELTANSADPIEIEHAVMYFDDLLGPQHAFNVEVGKSGATLTSFGPHSSYLADALVPASNEAALAGLDGDGWVMTDNYDMIEVNGTSCGRLDWAVGINQGASDVVRAPRNVYAHAGYKLGGVRLDGEESSSVPDPMKPWAENAITVDVFGQYASSKFNNVLDRAGVFGGSIRAQEGSLELNAGADYEMHSNDRGKTTNKGNLLRQWDELSYVIYPWLVPALRVDLIQFSPQNAAAATDVAVSAGAAALIRANLKATLIASMEHSSAPPAPGWGDMASADRQIGFEVETVSLGMAYAY